MMRLSKRHLLAAWRLVQQSAMDVFAPGVGERLPSLAGWAASGLPVPSDSVPLNVLEALRAIAELERERPAPTQVDLVVTGFPRGLTNRAVLRTEEVATGLLQSATSEILVLGFDIRDEGVLHLLQSKGAHSVSVTIVGDRKQAKMKDVKANWPASASPLRALQNVEPPEAGKTQGLMHAKVIAVDRKVALIGSANFTTGGFANNLEVGVRIAGPVVEQLCSLVDELHRMRQLEVVQ